MNFDINVDVYANALKDDDDNVSNELSSMNIDSSSHRSSNRKCLYCLQVVEGSLRCSKCRTALYCNRNCQEKHWPAHKGNCIDSNNTEDSIEKLAMKAINHSNQGNCIIYIYIYMYIYIYQRDIITNIIIVGNYQNAEKLFLKLLKRVRVKLGESHPDALNTTMNLATTYNNQGKRCRGPTKAVLR